MTIGKKRSKAQREADFNALADMYVKGHTQSEIASTIGISQGQVSNDLKKLLEMWREDRRDKIDVMRNEQLHKLNLMEKEMWEAWEKSKSHVQITATKGKSGEFKDSPSTSFISPRPHKVEDEKFWRADVTEKMPEAAGDMRYWSAIQWCIQERNKILGLYAPKKIAKTNPDGTKEAGEQAKEDFMGFIQSMVDKRNEGRKQLEEGNEDYVDGEVVPDDEEDTPQLAKILMERHQPSPPKALESGDEE